MNVESKITTKNKKSARIALTGGIASGKSLVSNFFRELKISVIDTDIISREILHSNKSILCEIRNSFGNHIFSEQGELKRKKLRKIIFENRKKRLLLGSIMHPEIRKETLKRIQMEEGVYHIIVIPLLYNSPMKNDVDRIIVVNCTDTIQLQRLLKRDSETISQAKHIISSQASRQDLLKIADDLIQNNQSKQATRSQVIKLHQKYLEFFS
jgi:dephospho-CoA kinase